MLSIKIKDTNTTTKYSKCKQESSNLFILIPECHVNCTVTFLPYKNFILSGHPRVNTVQKRFLQRISEIVR